MTAQMSDTITIDGAVLQLFAEPLEAYFSDAPEHSHPRPDFAPTNTANWRGYLARWEIRDGRLYITALDAELCERGGPEGWRCDKRRPFHLADLFPSSRGPVFADWYSGTLRVPLGAQMDYVHRGYESVYEFDLLLIVDRGLVTATRTIDNRRGIPAR